MYPTVLEAPAILLNAILCKTGAVGCGHEIHRKAGP